MMSLPCASDDSELKVLSQASEQEPISAELRAEIRKYLRLLPEIPEPNLTRVREIQEQIQQGTYQVTMEMIEETASRLAFRFLRKE